MERIAYTTKTGKKQWMPIISRMPDEGGWCLQCGHEVDGGGTGRAAG